MNIYSIWQYVRYKNGKVVEKWDNRVGQPIPMCKYEDIERLLDELYKYTKKEDANIGLAKVQHAIVKYRRK